MIQIIGNKQIEITQEQLFGIADDYEETILDLGTGDGRFVYKSALQYPTKLYLGIDPSAKQLEIYSKKARKEKLYNAKFIIGSIEIFPITIGELVDKMYITLPWGSLLQQIIQPEKTNIQKLSHILKKEGNLHIIIGYAPENEPSETNRLNLPPINLDLIQNSILPKLMEYGNFQLQQQKTLTNQDLMNFETTWSKKLSFGSKRPLFRLILKKC